MDAGRAAGVLRKPLTTNRLPIAVSLLLAAGATAACLAVWSAYYSHHPLWVEHAAYGPWSNIRFAEALARDGVWSAIGQYLAAGERHILQPALLGLVAPSLLSSPQAHVPIAGALLAVFLVLLVLFVRRRTGSAFLATLGVVLFCSLPGLYNERSGLGAPWPDYQSMLLLSSAVLALAMYTQSPRRGWLLLAGACISLAALARDTGAAYAVILCVPPMVVMLAGALRRDGWKRALPIAVWCALPALPAIVLLARKIGFFGQYYMTANVVQLRQPLEVSVRSIWGLLSTFCGPLSLTALAVLVAGTAAARQRRWTSTDTVVLSAPVLFLLFLLANGYTSDVPKEVMYLAPGLLACALTLRGGADVRQPWRRAVLAALVVACAAGAVRAATAAYRRATEPDAQAIALRESQRALAAALASIPRTVRWQSYARYDWGTVVAALTSYEFGHYQPTDNILFHNRRNYWDARFPGMALPELQAHVAREAETSVDVAVVLKDPARKPDGMEDYSFSIASAVAARVQASPQWQHYRDVETSVSGPLSLYLNLRRTPRQ